MNTIHYASLTVALLVLSGTACSRDNTSHSATATASSSANGSTVTTSTTQTDQGGMIERMINRRIKNGVSIDSETFKMRDGKLVISKDGKDVGTIAADGSMELDGQAVALTAEQRALAQRVHAQSQQVTTDAVEIAGAAASVASTAVSESMKVVASSIFKGDDPAAETQIEQRIEATVRDKIKPAAIKICNSSNAMEQSKRDLAASVPAYAKYYVADNKPCDPVEMEREFALKSADRPSSTQ